MTVRTRSTGLTAVVDPDGGVVGGVDSAIHTGARHVAAYTPGASEVKSFNLLSGDPTYTRQDLVTPTSGKKVRVIALGSKSGSATDTQVDFWFGPGAGVTTTPANMVMSFNHTDNTVNAGPRQIVFPDGGGPVGGVDEPLHVATGADVGAGNILYWAHYREE